MTNEEEREKFLTFFPPPWRAELIEDQSGYRLMDFNGNYVATLRATKTITAGILATINTASAIETTVDSREDGTYERGSGRTTADDIRRDF